MNNLKKFFIVLVVLVFFVMTNKLFTPSSWFSLQRVGALVLNSKTSLEPKGDIKNRTSKHVNSEAASLFQQLKKEVSDFEVSLLVTDSEAKSVKQYEKASELLRRVAHWHRQYTQSYTRIELSRDWVDKYVDLVLFAGSFDGVDLVVDEIEPLWASYRNLIEDSLEAVEGDVAEQLLLQLRQE